MRSARSPLTAGPIARIQLLSHAHMTVSVHFTRLAHAGHADPGRTHTIQFGTQLMQTCGR